MCCGRPALALLGPLLAAFLGLAGTVADSLPEHRSLPHRLGGTCRAPASNSKCCFTTQWRGNGFCRPWRSGRKQVSWSGHSQCQAAAAVSVDSVALWPGRPLWPWRTPRGKMQQGSGATTTTTGAFFEASFVATAAAGGREYKTTAWHTTGTPTTRGRRFAVAPACVLTGSCFFAWGSDANDDARSSAYTVSGICVVVRVVVRRAMSWGSGTDDP